MNEDLTIRKAELTDVKTITDYNIQLARETEDKQLNRVQVLLGVKAVIKDPQKGFYMVAETQGQTTRIVGQLMVTFEWSDWRNQWFWWIQSVYVENLFRDQKVFTTLYRAILRMAKSREDVCGLRLYVEEHNESAKHVYKALGMNMTSYEVYETLISQETKNRCHSQG